MESRVKKAKKSRSAAWRHAPVAVLISGGVDSAVLVGDLARTSPAVTPIYLRTGMYWESVEEQHVRRFLTELAMTTVRELVSFDLPIRELYGDHWSTTGLATPDALSEDEAVYLPGRNLLLLMQPMLWCRLNGVGSLAMALLAGNPFPDSSPAFFRDLERTFARAARGRVRLRRPYCKLAKAEVVQLGRDMPLIWSFSCIRPVDARHCGQCNKCAERQRGFREAAVPDPTVYAN